jgi:hypothetical protein
MALQNEYDQMNSREQRQIKLAPKIRKLEKYGCSIMIEQRNLGNTGAPYNVLRVDASISDEEFESLVDMKIEFFEQRAWLGAVNSPNPDDALKDICA